MRRFPTTAAACLLALLALAPPALGLSDPILDGKTTIRLDRGLYTQLRKNGVRLSPLKTGKLSGRAVTLPVSGGQMDPNGASGAVIQDGGLGFVVGKRTVRLNHFGISTASQYVSARVGGKQVRLAVIDDFDFSRRGFGNAYEIGALRLNRTAARLLNRKLGLAGVFKVGRSFGSISGTTVPESSRVQSGYIEVAAAEAFAEHLKSIEAGLVGFETTPVSQTPPTYRFPLLTGVVSLDMRGGFVGAEAGWRIYANPDGPGSVMTLTNMSMSFEPPAVRPLSEMGRLTARMQIHDAAGNPTMIGDVTLGTLSIAPNAQLVDPGSRTMTLTGTPAKIGPGFVDRLNEVFGGPKGKPNLFAYDEPLGTVSVTLTTH